MAGTSKIEWCDASWNPVVGCSVVSPGCTNCYAMRLAYARLDRPNGPAHYAGTTEPSNAGGVWSGKVAIAPEHILNAPLHWKKPHRIFVNSMGDLHHEAISFEHIDRVVGVMAKAPQHTFQILTKRAAGMQAYWSDPELADRVGAAMPLPNVWLGVSAERQQEADERVPLLLRTPAAVRFVSAEPLLGPIDLTKHLIMSEIIEVGDTEGGFIFPRGTRSIVANYIAGVPALHWVIVGGESGPRARPMMPNWARYLRDQCAAAGVAFFFKQCGEYAETDFSETLERVGKKAAGRLLDGREWNEFPGQVRA